MPAPSPFPIPRPNSALDRLVAVAFANDATTLLAIAEGKLLRCDADTRKPRWFPLPAGAGILAAGRDRVAVAAGTAVGLIDPVTSAVRRLRRPAGGRRVAALEWSRTGDVLAAFADGQVDLFRDGAFARRITDDAFAGGRGCVAPSGRVAGFADGSVVSFDPVTGKRAGRPFANMSGVLVYTLLGTSDGIAIAYEAPHRELAWRNESEWHVRFVDERGTTMTDVATGDRVVRGPEVVPKATLFGRETKSLWWGRICASADGSRVVMAAWSPYARVFDGKGKEKRPVKRRADPPNALAIGGGWLADARFNITVRPAVR